MPNTRINRILAVLILAAAPLSPAGKSFDKAPIQPDRLVPEAQGDADLVAAASLIRESLAAAH